MDKVAMTDCPCSAVILAGGESKRFNGRNKAYMKIGGERVMDRIMAVFEPLFDEIILVTNHPRRYLAWNTTIVTDHFDRRSSLTGIHAGLFAASHPHVLVSGCDMPFVQPRMLRLLLGALKPQLDVVIPKTALGFEPLQAIYSKRCLKPMAAALNAYQFQIQKILRHVRVERIEEPELRACDADLISFMNVNSPEDLARAEEILRRQPRDVI